MKWKFGLNFNVYIQTVEFKNYNLKMNQKKCGHCKLVGHNQSNCDKATIDASHFYQQVRSIKERDASIVKDSLSYYFNSLMTVHDLSILMKYIENYFQTHTYIVLNPTLILSKNLRKLYQSILLHFVTKWQSQNQ